jgi:2'-5' RNA ligase
VPHLTLARIKPEPRSELGKVLNGMQHEERRFWGVSSFALMRSTLGPGGARYEVVREFI